MLLFQWKEEASLIMVVDAYNPSTEAKPRGSQGPDQFELHSETLSLSHTHKKPQNNLKI